MNTRELGSSGEEISRNYLKSKGYEILESNFHASRIAEIDIIAKDKDTIVFTEVKYRQSLTKGYGREAVTKAKQKNIRYGALYYLTIHKKNDAKCRFDVLEITHIGDEIDIIHLENCF